MAIRAAHLALGADGEEAAAQYLTGKGWRIVDRNWRPAGTARGGELDLVARHEGQLIFVEVKTRKRTFFPLSEEKNRNGPLHVPTYAAFTAQKRTRLLRAARHYLSAYNLWNLPCRFDLLCVEQGPDGKLRLEHHRNAIELGNLMDSGDASWQPW